MKTESIKTLLADMNNSKKHRKLRLNKPRMTDKEVNHMMDYSLGERQRHLQVILSSKLRNLNKDALEQPDVLRDEKYHGGVITCSDKEAWSGRGWTYFCILSAPWCTSPGFSVNTR